MEKLLSCKYEKDHAEARLVEIQKQTSNLPQVFPWPGLGERRQAVDQARNLLDQSTTLVPVLSAVRSQVNTEKSSANENSFIPQTPKTLPHCLIKAEELFEMTKDQSWTDPSWTAWEEAIPALLTQLTVSLTRPWL